MIKPIEISVEGTNMLRLAFSDGSGGHWSAAELIARDTVMTRPLADPAYFARAFIESGALAWPNGFELSAHSLHQRMEDNSSLIRSAA